MTYALQVTDAYKTFYEDDDEAGRPWWRIWQRRPRRKVVAVDRVSFTVKAGECFGILGPNGSGKSTLIRLILLDEPTTGLDPKSKRDVQDSILEVQRNEGATVILTSHDMEESDRLCRRVAFIADGKFVAEGTPAKLKARYGAANLEDLFFAATGKTWEEELAE